MVDRVELELVHEVAQVRRLDDGDAVVREDRRDPCDDTVHVGNVREHVVRVEHGCPAPFGAEPRRDLGTEEVAHRRHAVLLGDARDVAGGVDAEDRHAGVDVVTQEIAVVARDLHREVVGTQLPFRDEAGRDRTRVLDDRVRERREVGVLLEHVLRRNRERDLDERALAAEDQLQGIARLRPRERLVGEQRIRERC